MQNAWLAAAVGLLVGFLSGLFGVGGSSIATPILRLFSVPQLIALATPLPVTLPTAVAGGFVYWRRGMVNVRAAGWTAAGGVPGVVAGSYLTTVAPGRLLMVCSGAFVMAVGIRLLRSPAPVGPAAPVPPKRTRYLWLGLGIGFLSGLLANGGGFLLMPAYVLLFRMDARESAATSLVAVALLALPGSWIHWTLGHIDLRLALHLALGVIPGTYLGAHVGAGLPGGRSRTLFGWFLLGFGALFLLRTLYRAEHLGWW